MRKFYLSLVKSEDAVSWPLLLVSFLGGFILATTIFHFFGHSVRTLLSF